MEPMELSCLVFENKGLAIDASAKLLGRVLDKLHGFRGFIGSSDTERIMDKGEELTYSSQDPTANNVKVSYILRELPWINLEIREGLEMKITENIPLGVTRYSGLICIKNLDEPLQKDLLAIREDFKRGYDVINGIARLKELK